MLKIIGMAKTDLIENLNPYRITHKLTGAEILYIAETLEAFWYYDYLAAYRDGKWGYHAKLKGGDHSDGFFSSKFIFQYPKIRTLVASQIVMRVRAQGWSKILWIAGVPNGATKLAKEIAVIMDAKFAEIVKEDGQMVCKSKIDFEDLLLVEDVHSTGKGFREAIVAVEAKAPKARIIPLKPVILNRTTSKYDYANVAGFLEKFKIISLAKIQLRTWDPKDYCSLCKDGSKPIKPKATAENWRLITTSQL